MVGTKSKWEDELGRRPVHGSHGTLLRVAETNWLRLFTLRPIE